MDFKLRIFGLAFWPLAQKAVASVLPTKTRHQFPSPAVYPGPIVDAKRKLALGRCIERYKRPNFSSTLLQQARMRSPLLLLLALLCLGGCLQFTNAALRPTHLNAMRLLCASVGPAVSWTCLDNPCTWSGVSCDPQGSSVVRLNLYVNHSCLFLQHYAYYGSPRASRTPSAAHSSFPHCLLLHTF